MNNIANRMARSHLSRLAFLAAITASFAPIGCASKVQLGQTAATGGSLGLGGGLTTSVGVGGGTTAPGVGGSTTAPGVGGGTPTWGGAGTTTGGRAQTSFEFQANRRISGIDLLLMIDNSASMADKQATLATAVPQLLGQLVQPQCVDAQGNPTGSVVQLGAAAPCVSGTPEFNPINNIHIGIVTSSLGDHGANTLCTPGAPTQYVDPTTGAPIVTPPDVNDMSHLVGTLARATAARTDPQTAFSKLNPLGFLEWGDANLPNPGAADLAAANLILKDLVTSTKEVGCGYESQLESWFRFLIDPVPPVLPIARPDAQSQTHRTGSDDTLLNQRAAFLRPDSMVAIIMLTDENDCSIRDTDVGWVSATTTDSITRGSDQCATNPNDRCCYSCTAGAPSGCAAACTPPVSPASNKAVDDSAYQANIRCWNQKRRFGYEFLYPTSRYVVGLTKPELCPDQSFGDMDCDCTYAMSIGAGCDAGARRMPNPLYSTIVGTLNNGQQLAGYPNSVARMDNSQVFIAGIVGVPWQDIGTLGSDGTLKYIPVIDPAWTSSGAGTQPANPPVAGGGGIWDMIYGKDSANIQPKDVHMVESIVPRPLLPGPTAAANADPFNGHEYNTARYDLEYACTYTLPTSRPCQCTPGDANYASCKYQHPNDCCDQTFQADGAGGPAGSFNKPICNGTTQVAAKAYPGLREIAVLHDYATSPYATTQGNSVVASICPKDLASAATSAGYGYNPAVATLIDRIKGSLRASCEARALPVKTDGTLSCSVFEAVPADKLNGQSCSAFCSANHRLVPNSTQVADATVALRNANVCDGNSNVACSSMCFCQLPQESGADLTTCQNATDGSDVTLPPGYCYIDPNAGVGNAELVANCPATQRRLLRFVGNNPTGTSGISVPLAGAFVLKSCSYVN